MASIFSGPKIEVTTHSGTLSVTVRQNTHWLVAVFLIIADLGFAIALYKYWSVLPIIPRVIWLWALIGSVPSMFYHALGEETIEITAQKLSIRKGIHGWERKRDFEINDCRELQWRKGSKNSPRGLECKVSWRSVTFGSGLSEDDAIEIMASLQRTLPDVAQKICALPGPGEHFLTLGLNR
jgi:hypothetical protein